MSTGPAPPPSASEQTTRVRSADPPAFGGDRIVVGFDGSVHARDAVMWAADEAALTGRELRIVWGSTVPSPVDYYGVGVRQHEILMDVVDTLQRRYPLLAVTYRATHLDPRDALVDEASSAGLLVVGAATRGHARTLLLGSVSRVVARRSPTPVVIVRGESRHPIRRIVAGVDGSTASMAALEWACVEAQRHHAELVVLHAWQPGHDSKQPDADSPGSDPANQRALQMLDACLGTCRERGVTTVDGHLVEGPPSVVLTDASNDADLLVVGSRGRNALKTMLLGSSALFVADNASCPIAICRPRHMSA